MNNKELRSSFEEVMLCERMLSDNKWPFQVTEFEKIWPHYNYIKRFIKNCTLSRSFNSESYGRERSEFAFESVGAHAFLVEIILDRALSFIYGENFVYTKEGYSRREFLEAARRHDLPENIIGDIPDDGRRNDAEMARSEQAYWKEMKDDSDSRFEERVYWLLREMGTKQTEAGRILFLADKTSAILRVLMEESLGYPAVMDTQYEKASVTDVMAMMMSDSYSTGKVKASEIWSISYFRLRNTILCDETGFFTALIVMMTLEVNDCWYDWRLGDYLR